MEVYLDLIVVEALSEVVTDLSPLISTSAMNLGLPVPSMTFPFLMIISSILTPILNLNRVNSIPVDLMMPAIHSVAQRYFSRISSFLLSSSMVDWWTMRPLLMI